MDSAVLSGPQGRRPSASAVAPDGDGKTFSVEAAVQNKNSGSSGDETEGEDRIDEEQSASASFPPKKYKNRKARRERVEEEEFAKPYRKEKAGAGGVGHQKQKRKPVRDVLRGGANKRKPKSRASRETSFRTGKASEGNFDDEDTESTEYGGISVFNHLARRRRRARVHLEENHWIAAIVFLFFAVLVLAIGMPIASKKTPQPTRGTVQPGPSAPTAPGPPSPPQIPPAPPLPGPAPSIPIVQDGGPPSDAVPPSQVPPAAARPDTKPASPPTQSAPPAFRPEPAPSHPPISPAGKPADEILSGGSKATLTLAKEHTFTPQATRSLIVTPGSRRQSQPFIPREPERRPPAGTASQSLPSLPWNESDIVNPAFKPGKLTEAHFRFLGRDD